MEPKKQIFNDIWAFYKAHIGITSDEDWERTTKESQELINKHGSDPYAKDLIYAVLNELGRAK